MDCFHTCLLTCKFATNPPLSIEGIEKYVNITVIGHLSDNNIWHFNYIIIMALSAFSSKCQILSNLTVLRKIVPIDVWPNRCLIWHNAIFICMRHVTQIGNQQRYQMMQTNLFQWHFLGNEPHSSAKVQSIGTILRCTLLFLIL